MAELRPRQYKIGDTVFGKFTDIKIVEVQVQPYNVNNQDFQLPRSDEVRFGIDTLAPGPLMFKMSVLNNYGLESMEGLTGEVVNDALFAGGRSIISKLANEWKASPVRASWNLMKPITYCSDDGITRRVYGRPGKFAYVPSEMNDCWYDVQAEFRRADTNAYNDIEYYVEVSRGDNPTWIMQDGDAPTWFRVLFYGPIHHPVVTVGANQIELDVDIPAGVMLEVSSYPWMRRVVDSNGVNWRTKVVGSTRYLDQCMIPANEMIPIRWTDTDTVGITWTELPNTKWSENVDFLDIFTLWDTWESIHGTVFWGGNLQSGGYVFGPFGIAAALDSANRFVTGNQFVQCRVAQNTFGKSALVSMSNDTMTNFVCAEIEDNWEVIGQKDYLRLQTGTAYNARTDRFTFEIPGKIKGHETFGVWSAMDTPSPGQTTFTLQWNGEDVGSWVDTAGVVNTANRRQGLIVNSGNTPLISGAGLDNIVAYDISVDPPEPQGQCFVMWRDAYSIM